jgi:hypothetical protein
LDEIIIARLPNSSRGYLRLFFDLPAAEFDDYLRAQSFEISAMKL